jgi:GNAT superfamily N-acetyltransferase
VPQLTFRVEHLQRRDEPTAAAALARAFHYDPLFEYFIPNRARQHRGALRFMESSIRDARPFNETWAAFDEDGKVASVAIWLPPEGYPRSNKRELLTLAHTAPTFARAGRRATAGLRMMSELDRAHHETERPHYYLAVLGTDPLYARQGAASAALAPVLERCDVTGVPAYLETQKEENLAFYNRHGFEFVRMIETKGVPPLWTMLRSPRS